MKKPSLLSACCLMLLGLFEAHGHTSPVGEVYPTVTVLDKQFRILTMTHGANLDNQPYLITEYALDGRFISKQWVSPSEWSAARDKAVGSSAKENIGYHPLPTSTVPPGGEPSRLCLNINTNGKWKHTPIPMPESVVSMRKLLRPDGMAMVWMRFVPSLESPGSLDMAVDFVWLNRSDFKMVTRVDLGIPAAINEPCISELVWAENRVWFAWVRKAENFEQLPPTKQWVTVLANYDAATKKLEQKVLPEKSHWNTRPSINTTGGWLCVAWHCSKDGSYPGESMIVKHFEKLPLSYGGKQGR